MHVPASFSGIYLSSRDSSDLLNPKIPRTGWKGKLTKIGNYIYTIGVIIPAFSGAHYNILQALRYKVTAIFTDDDNRKKEAYFQSIRYRNVYKVDRNMFYKSINAVVLPILIPASVLMVASASFFPAGLAICCLGVGITYHIAKNQNAFNVLGNMDYRIYNIPSGLMRETKYFYQKLAKFGWVEKTPLTQEEINKFDTKYINKKIHYPNLPTSIRDLDILREMNKISSEGLEKLKTKHNPLPSPGSPLKQYTRKFINYINVKFSRNYF